MAHGSTHLQARAMPHLRREWFAASRRGAIFGVVIALHLALLALLFGPVTPRSPTTSDRSKHHQALLMRLLVDAPRPRPANPLPPPLTPAKPMLRRASVTAAVPANAAVPAHSAQALVVEPTTVAGDYHSPLLGGRAGVAVSSSMPHLPGSDVARVQGLTLQASSSLKQTVRAMTKGNRCKYTRMKMANSAHQFITGQLMDRALGADGCGPQVPHTADDRAVEVISHQAIFGH